VRKLPSLADKRIQSPHSKQVLPNIQVPDPRCHKRNPVRRKRRLASNLSKTARKQESRPNYHNSCTANLPALAPKGQLDKRNRLAEMKQRQPTFTNPAPTSYLKTHHSPDTQNADKPQNRRWSPRKRPLHSKHELHRHNRPVHRDQ
jgi:hypothetical protein